MWLNYFMGLTPFKTVPLCSVVRNGAMKLYWYSLHTSLPQGSVMNIYYYTVTYLRMLMREMVQQLCFVLKTTNHVS